MYTQSFTPPPPQSGVGTSLLITGDAPIVKTIGPNTYLRSGVMVELSDYPNFPSNRVTPYRKGATYDLPSAVPKSMAWNGTTLCYITNNLSFTSTDGITWSFSVLPATAKWTLLAAKGSTFCLLASGSNVAYTSPDGVTWTVRSLPVTAAWSAAAVSSGVICVVANDASGYLVTSPDGITWTQRTAPADNLSQIVWNGTVFATTVPLSTNLYTSPDGVTWTTRSGVMTGGAGTCLGIAGTNIVYSASANTSYYSSNSGVSFASGGATGTVAAAAFGWSGSLLVMVDVNGTKVTTTSGVTWSATTGSTTASSTSILAWAGTFMALANGANNGTSPTGTAWTERASAYSGQVVANPNSLLWNGSTFCCIFNRSQLCATSPDGITWTMRSMPSASSWSFLAWSGTQFCAVSFSGTVAATSPDGVTWTARTLPASVTWSSLTWGGSSPVFLLMANSGTAAYTSPDGITWTSRTVPSNSYVGCAWGNGQFLAIVDASVYITSPDGITWTSKTYSLGASASGVAHNGKYFAVVCANSTYSAYRSQDGITWTRSSKPSSASSSQLCSIGGRFFIDNCYSDDAILWVAIDYSATVITGVGGTLYGVSVTSPPTTSVYVSKSQIGLPTYAENTYLRVA